MYVRLSFVGLLLIKVLRFVWNSFERICSRGFLQFSIVFGCTLSLFEIFTNCINFQVQSKSNVNSIEQPNFWVPDSDSNISTAVPNSTPANT